MKYNYSTAVSQCQMRNASILSLETELEANFFRDRIADAAVWHGLHKMNSTAGWQFPSSNSAFRDWLPGEPTDGYQGSQVDVSPSYGWKSASLASQASVICERGMYLSFDFFRMEIMISDD